VRLLCSAPLLNFLYGHHLPARVWSYQRVCMASAHDALLVSDKVGVECLLFAGLVMKAYVCIFPVEAPVRSRLLPKLPKYSHPASEGGE
jgi:hypothetical protein